MSRATKWYMFESLQFYFVPNVNTSKVTFARKNLARNGMAIVNKQYDPRSTTHVLIDTKVLHDKMDIIHELRRNNVQWNAKLVDQMWLVDSIEARRKLDTRKYELNLNGFKTPDSKTSKEEAKSDKDKEHSAPEETSSDLLEINPNQRTMEILDELSEEMLMLGETFRARAYKNAIGALQNTTSFISTAEQAVKLKGIGQSIANKIDEIVRTNSLQVLNKSKYSKSQQIKNFFQTINGVGPGFAKKWYDEGLETLEDVAERTDLTVGQRYGVIYYHDWKERIPRAECFIHNQLMEKLAHSIDPSVELTIGGSYRRGEDDCGDIDFLITKPDAEMEELHDFLIKLIAKMEQIGYLKCSLMKPSSKFFAGCALPPKYNEKLPNRSGWGKCRRVDLLLVPWKERGAAFIYFTGNDYFNRTVRLKALKNGLVLNECGLFKRIGYQQGKNVKDKLMLIESFSERKIFKLLGIQWTEPQDRNFNTGNPVKYIGKSEWKVDKNHFEEVMKEDISDFESEPKTAMKDNTPKKASKAKRKSKSRSKSISEKKNDIIEID